VKTLEQIIHPIAAELAQFEAFFEKTMNAETKPMDNIMYYVLDSRGKRMRPILVLLSAKLFGEINSQTLRAATFVEMVHSATLIHDDVVDDSNLRRNHASVKARFGNLSAVLAGDYLLAKAMLLLAQPNDYAILQEMLHTAAAMSEGELMQGASIRSLSSSKGQDKNVEAYKGRPFDRLSDLNYLDIITRKTATLMRSCCVAGALSVNATPEQVQQIADFGINFGILFQLRDDILDSENVAQAQSLLPIYHEKTLKALEGFPPSEIAAALRDLTVFCAERES
jgi:octaprenyl-diphosphate synthase